MPQKRSRSSSGVSVRSRTRSGHLETLTANEHNPHGAGSGWKRQSRVVPSNPPCSTITRSPENESNLIDARHQLSHEHELRVTPTAFESQSHPTVIDQVEQVPSVEAKPATTITAPMTATKAADRTARHQMERAAAAISSPSNDKGKRKAPAEVALSVINTANDYQSPILHVEPIDDICDSESDGDDSYGKSLVHGKFRSGQEQDPTANYILHNSYNQEQHLRMLADTWQSLENTALLLALREHFAIAIRHAMLLRDEDLRNLNQSDCFFKELTDVRHVGTQKILALVFCLRNSKSNQSGDTQCSMAVRHVDVRRCAIGAMAFYFFERWTVFEDDHSIPGSAPVFDEAWLEHKVLHSADKESHEPMSYSAARDSTFKVLERQRVGCAHITHSGRHSGALEGLSLGVPIDNIRYGGRWNQGAQKVHEFYLNSSLAPFALGISGFRENTFHLRRNEEWPSKDLQRQVFPFIETALYEAGSTQRQEWINECDSTMMEYTPTRIDSTDDDDVDPFCSTQQPHRVVDNGFLTRPQHHFLLMLVRMRSIVLQDAAAYIAIFNSRKSKGTLPPRATLESMNPVLNREVFKTQAFMDFQHRVEKAIRRVDVPPPASPAPDVAQLFKNMGATMKNFSRSISELERKVEDLYQLQHQRPHSITREQPYLDNHAESTRQARKEHQQHPVQTVHLQHIQQHLQPPLQPRQPYQHAQRPQQPQSCRQQPDITAASTPAPNTSNLLATKLPLAPPLARQSNEVTRPSNLREQRVQPQSLIQVRQATIIPLAPPVIQRAVFPLLKEKQNKTFRSLTIEDILEEQKRYAEFKEQHGHRQDDTIMKILNNRKRVVEELEYVVRSSAIATAAGRRRMTQEEGIEVLKQVQVMDRITKEMRPWKSINELFKYCQAKQRRRGEERPRQK